MKQPVGIATSPDGTDYEVHFFLDSDMEVIDPNTADPEDVAWAVVLIDDVYTAFRTSDPERIELH